MTDPLADADWAALLGRTPDRCEGTDIGQVLWFGAERVILARPPAESGRYFDDRYEAAAQTGGVRLVVDGPVRAMVLPAALADATEVIVADVERAYQVILPKGYQSAADEVARGLVATLTGHQDRPGLS